MGGWVESAMGGWKVRWVSGKRDGWVESAMGGKSVMGWKVKWFYFYQFFLRFVFNILLYFVFSFCKIYCKKVNFFANFACFSV